MDRCPLPPFSNGSPDSRSRDEPSYRNSNETHRKVSIIPLELPKDAPESLKEYLKVSPRLSLDGRCRPSKVNDT
jgi:hypothetical protein